MEAFQSFGLTHLTPILIAGGILTILLYRSKDKPFAYKRKIALVLSLVTVIGQITGPIMEVVLGSFSIQEDLPLFLCRVLAYMLPLAIYYDNKKWLHICYFWVLAGTIQAVATPDIDMGYPHYLYFIYWILHLGLVCTTLYYTITYPIKITWHDFWNAILYTQVFLLIVHGTNYLLDSNYSYTMRKPPGPSLLDVMGSWPWYLFSGQGIMVVSFLILMIPFLIKSKTKLS